VQVDKLIQLIESPIFTYLRLQLLQPNSYAHLIKCLYGLLMLLPQVCHYEDRALYTYGFTLFSLAGHKLIYSSLVRHCPPLVLVLERRRHMLRCGTAWTVSRSLPAPLRHLIRERGGAKARTFTCWGRSSSSFPNFSSLSPSKKGGHQFKGNVNKPLPYEELLARFDEVQVSWLMLA
jgi:hypothetical protein